MLFESGFPPHRLDIEITESCLHENVGVVRSVVTSLKNQGIQISLDDFGTGYANLAQLNQLPVDRLKIDRSFISALDSNKENATIVQAIASLGEGMNLPVTAEGIETAEVLAELRALGKFKGQGNLYGRPCTATQFHAILAEKGLLLHDPKRDTQLDLRPGEADQAPDRSGTHG
jgi:EAL domain-containing protein (putative c-di-GMP-specific phosphodiesterase class I)